MTAPGTPENRGGEMCIRDSFNPLLQAENLRMLQKGCCADVRPLVQFLRRMPLNFEPRLLFSDAIPTGSSS